MRGSNAHVVKNLRAHRLESILSFVDPDCDGTQAHRAKFMFLQGLVVLTYLSHMTQKPFGVNFEFRSVKI